MKTFALLLVLLACLVAAAICGHLLALHAPIQTVAQREALKQSVWAGVCGGEEEDGADDCQAVISSKYGFFRVPWLVREGHFDSDGQVVSGAISWGRKAIPVAQVGLYYYLFIGVWFLFTGVPTRGTRRWHVLPLVASILALAASLNFISVMAFSLEQWCPLCMILHGIDLLLVVAMIVMWPRRRAVPSRQAAGGSAIESTPGRAGGPAPEAVPGEAPMNLRLVGATLAVAFVLCGASFGQREIQIQMAAFAKRVQQMQKEIKSYGEDEHIVINAYIGTEPQDVPVRPAAAELGPADAPHTLVVFSDLECPNCKNFEIALQKSILPLWRDQLKVVFRHYPLCIDCNRYHQGTFTRPQGLHPSACLVAYASEAARLQGGNDAFWKIHELIFENQQRLATLGEDGLVGLAEQTGLDGARFRSDMNSAEVKGFIEHDVEDGRRLGVSGTPSIFLDGRYIHRLQRGSMSFWKKVIERHLGPAPPEEGASDTAADGGDETDGVHAEPGS